MGVTIKRSPSYPALPLSDAITRARAFFKAEGKHEALVPTAAGHWKYGPKSSGGLVTVAALKAYGLMADRGNGPDRKVHLTPFGLSIVQDERLVSPDRDAAIKKAALTPKIMAELWSKYQDELPSKDTVYHFLKVEKEFNENAVADVLDIYVKNLQFAKLNESTDQQGSSGEGDDDLATDGLPNSDRAPPPPLVITPAPAIASGASLAGGEEIGNYRVSKATTIRLTSFGPYSRQSIESLVKQLQLALDLGNFDDDPSYEDGLS